MEGLKAGFANGCIKIAPFHQDVCASNKSQMFVDFKNYKRGKLSFEDFQVDIWRKQFQQGEPLVGYGVYSQKQRDLNHLVGFLELRQGSGVGRVELRLYSCWASDDLVSEYSLFTMFKEKIAPLLSQLFIDGNPITAAEMVVSKKNYVGQKKLPYYGFKTRSGTSENIRYEISL